MEAELREILRTALQPEKPQDDLYTAIRRVVEPYGGFDIPEVADAAIEPPRFD